MAGKVRWEEMFPDEIEAAVATMPLAWLPFGCLERHGAHLALGNDALKAHALCVLAAEAHGGVVMPVSYMHMGGDECSVSRRWLASMGHPKLWGPYLPPELFYPMFLALLRQMELLGFRAAIAITGHYGGPEHDMRLLAERFMERSPLRVRALGDGEVIGIAGIGGDHAGRTETSQLAYLRPELVDMGRIPEQWAPEQVAGRDGLLGSAELGERIVVSQLVALGELATALLAEYRDWQGHTPLTTAEVLALWEDIWAHERERLVCQA